MIAISGGGTGGHLVIAKNIKEELNKRGIKPIFIGSTYGQDRLWFENDSGFEATFFLNSKGVVNKGFFGKIYQLLKILYLSLKQYQIFKKYNIQKVFSVGGFSSAPTVFGAIFFKKELYIHEQNSVIGSLNKIAKPFAKEFFSSFDKMSYCKDYPILDSFLTTKRIRKNLKCILFLGGSLGAVSINELAFALSKDLLKKGIKIIHITGERNYQQAVSFYKKENLNVEVKSFDKNLAQTLFLCDFAISRAGASSVFELSANAIPTLFIPYPYAAKDHQYHNAKFLANKKLAFVIRENEIDKDKILELIFSVNLEEISAKLFHNFTKNGSECIVERLLKNT